MLNSLAFFISFSILISNAPFSMLFDRLYCYAQKHVKSIKAVTKDPCEITEKRYRSIRRINKPNKKLKIRNFHHSSPYHVSDHKAAITVGVIMGVFLGKALTSCMLFCFVYLKTFSECVEFYYCKGIFHCFFSFIDQKTPKHVAEA